MAFRTEGTSDNADTFLREVVEEKIAELARRIEKELSKGLEADGEDVARLTAARAKFSEILRSPRIFLAGAAEGGAASRAEASARPIVPLKESGAEAPSRPASGGATARPAAVGQMRAFLENLRSGGAPAPAAGPAPHPAAGPAVSRAAAPARAASSAAVGRVDSPRAGAERPDDAGAVRRKVVESLKSRAASQGFSDVYELLRFKKERIQEAMKTLASSRADIQVIQGMRKDLREIDVLLEQDLEKMVHGIEEFDEVADVDRGGLAALRKEVAGLMKEIR